MSWSVLLCPPAPSLTRLQMHAYTPTFWHELQGLNPNVSDPWQVPLPTEPSVSSAPVLLHTYHCSYLISHTSLEYGSFVAFPPPLLRTSSLTIMYTIHVSQKNAGKVFNQGMETSKTVRQHAPFVFISWLTQAVCYSKGRFTGLWTVTIAPSLVLRNTGSPDWLPLPSRLLSFLSCSSSAISWKFNQTNVLGLQPLSSPPSIYLMAFCYKTMS